MNKSFTVNDEYVEGEVYKETTSKGAVIYLVKIKFLEIGLYINSIRVQESPRFPERGLWVQMPVTSSGRNFYKVIECDGASQFLEIVERHAREAVAAYIGGGNRYPTIKDKDRHAHNADIDLNDIPF